MTGAWHLSHFAEWDKRPGDVCLTYAKLATLLLAQVLECHDGMAEGHARSGIAHDGLDARLRLAALAMRLAILTVALMSMGARGRASERLLDGLAAFRAHASGVLLDAIVIAVAVNAANGLHRAPVFVYSLHEASIDECIRQLLVALRTLMVVLE